MKAYDVCIVGAGPVGGALGCRLAAAGMKVAVIDRAALPPMAHPDFDGRAYAIAAGSRRLLQQAGLWDALPLPTGPIEQIRVSDGHVGRPASPLFLHFDVGDLRPSGTATTSSALPSATGGFTPWTPTGVPPASQIGNGPICDAGGTPVGGAGGQSPPPAGGDAEAPPALGWMLEARSLRMALNDRLHALNSLDVFAPAQANVTRAPEGATVQLSTGETLSAPLVVAAEGRDSPLRRQARIPAQRWPYHQSGIVACITHEKPHHRIALEHFLPAGPFAQLPMADNEAGEPISAIVWTERSEHAPRYMALDDATFAYEIQRRLGSHLGSVRAVGRRWVYPLSAMYVHRVTAERLVLVGDAAHGIHPIAGQGLNLGLRDALALSDRLIAAHEAGDDIGAPALLRQYARARQVDVLSMLAATDSLDRLFSTNNPAVRLVRDLGIAAVHRIPRLKRAFMRQAMGLT